MPAPPRVLVVQPDERCPAGLFGEHLGRAGLACDVVPGPGTGAPGLLRAEHRGLLVLGGEMGATDDDRHPWLAATRTVVAAAVGAGRPFLGICLGHQLGAVALGGRVTRNPHGPTRALLPLAPGAAGRTDPLLSTLPAGTDVLHWNDDVVVELPPGAEELTTAPDGTVQAARLAPRAWGVQFHPEVDARIVAGWGHGEPSDRERDVAAAVREREAALHLAWGRLADRFGELVLAG